MRDASAKSARRGSRRLQESRAGGSRLANRTRIKPSHRRRRKAASAHLVYILNNPLSGTDPTGYEACTGSNIDRNDGGNCADQGVHTTQVASRSEDPKQMGNGRQTQSTRVVSANAAEATSLDKKPALNSPGAPTGPQPAQGQGEGQTLETVTVTPVGFFLNPAEERAVRSLSYQDVQRGKNEKSETALMLDVSGNTLKRTQNGCRGGSDRCTVDPAARTSVFGHSHVYPEINNSVSKETRAILNLSREMPGQGDAGSLSQGIPGAVWTPGGYKWAIEGTSTSPAVRYLEGGDASFGRYVEKNWRPNDKNLILKVARDYLEGTK